MIRTGQDYSFVELSLNLPNEEDTVIISREINLNGKNLCKINGRMVTVNELREYMQDIIDIHGQHDNQSILEPGKHIEYLDYFAGESLLKLKKNYQEHFEKWNSLNKELQANYGDEKEKQRKLDLLKYQQNEIQSASLKIGEDENLELQRKLILNSEAISENLESANYQLSEIAMDALNTAKRNLEKIEDLDSKYKDALENITEIYYNLEEASRDVSGLNGQTDFDESQRQEIEERLDLIFSLKRKYGNSIEEILKYEEEISK